MREEIFVSGRNLPNIDPQLHIWHWPIPLYLFLGGLAAGLLFFASFYYIKGNEKEMPSTMKYGPFIALGAIVLGLGALLFDLTHIAYVWQLFMNFRIDSPMSWGAWTLLVISILNTVWCAIHIKEVLPNWDWKFDFVKKFLEFAKSKQKLMAWAMLFLAVILGIYTGILLSAFNARPLWNTSILGPLFLASGLSAGAAMLMWISNNHHERIIYSRLDLILIGIELFFIIHMFMGFRASTQVQIEAANLFLGGHWTIPFWTFVVGIGMVVPALLEIFELRGKKIPVYIPALLVLFGSAMLRFIITFAGQESRYLY